jgi:hypothetical protein
MTTLANADDILDKRSSGFDLPGFMAFYAPFAVGHEQMRIAGSSSQLREPDHQRENDYRNTAHFNPS